MPTVVLLVAATVALDALAAPRRRADQTGVATALAAHDALAASPRRASRPGCCSARRTRVRAHLRRERRTRGRTALLIARPGPVRTRHHQWRAAGAAAGLPGGAAARAASAAVEAPAGDAERLVRALDLG